MDSTGSVFAVGQDAEFNRAIAECLLGAGYETRVYSNPDLAKREIQNAWILIVDCSELSDSYSFFRSLRDANREAEFIAFLDPADSNADVLHEHVFDSFLKPLHAPMLLRSVARAIERRQLKLENQRLLQQLQQTKAVNGAPPRQGVIAPALVGESNAMERVRHFIAEVAPSDMTVLLRGESGTGKDVLARAIHEASGRGGMGNFVKINCPAIPETLLESELFGHEPGAFTGADRRKPGRMELAAGGTIFLDEIGEIPPSVQAKLLQAIEHKQFTRLGGSRTIRTDARIIAATNAPLESMIANERFRSDLFYRLDQYSIVLPPLRERVEDIPLLIDHFLEVHGAQNGKSDLKIGPNALSKLVTHPWPGNVRELEAVIRRFVLSGKEESIEAALKLASEPAAASPRSDKLRQSEIQTIMAALAQARWNQRQAAQILGISYSSLRRRISKYDLKSRWLERMDNVTRLQSLRPN